MNNRSEPRDLVMDAWSERRLAAAIAAAMAVLAAGAIFIAAAVSRPPGLRESLAVAPVAGPERLSVPPTAPAPAPILAVVSPKTVESELTLVRSIRLGDAPSLSPRRPAPGLASLDWRPKLSRAHKATGVAAIASPPSPTVGAGAEPARPMALGGTWLATAEDRPPPVYFEGDLAADRTPPPPPAVAFAGDLPAAPHETRVLLTRGETFVDALRRANVRIEDRNAAAAAFAREYNLRALRPGQEFALTISRPYRTVFQTAAASEGADAHLLALDFRVDPKTRLTLSRGADGAFRAVRWEAPMTTRLVAIAGPIHGSLFASAKRQGAPDEVIAQLSTVFAYDVDFQREVFGGDEFEAIFEVEFDETGRLAGASDVIFARMKWKGRKKEKGYYRFAASDQAGTAEYFDRSGKSAKRLLMKTPVDGARLSSGFGSRRHPIKGYVRDHKGIDFAAPTGTPIMAAGDGVVERANRYGGYGNYVRIKHSGGYKTAYAHLSRFAKGMRAGRRVEQGDVIGYVGSTGSSTGPHLHYEVLSKDRHVNPMNLKIATGVELSGRDLERFRSFALAIDQMRAPTSDADPDLLADASRKAL